MIPTMIRFVGERSIPVNDTLELFYIAPEPWMRGALCAEVDPEAFFPEGSNSSTEAAKKVCDLCGVRRQCLVYALANGERFGVWGGLGPMERARLKGFVPSGDGPRRVLKPCLGGCGRLTRGGRTRLRDAPNTVLRFRGGFCESCWKAREEVEPGVVKPPGHRTSCRTWEITS